MKEENGKKQVEVGDKVRCQGRIWTISDIHNQFYSKNEGFFLEFYDDKGDFHYWKQYEDGGDIIPLQPGKTIRISEELERKILRFCDDELNYHINESGCAEEYHNEIMAQIELFQLLGYPNLAEAYENDYHKYLEEHYEDIDFVCCSEVKKYCDEHEIDGHNKDDMEKDEYDSVWV